MASLLLASSLPAHATPSASASRYASIVMEAETGVVLYERNADIPRYPASLTKIMTLYLTFEALASKRLSLTDDLVFSAHAAGRDPSRLDLAPGSRLKVEDAIRAMTTKSANDAACALAERIGRGSETTFSEMMTAKGKALGLTQTTFHNASGLPDMGHISSARDLALLSRAVVRDYPDYYSYFATESFNFHGKRYPNQNRFLRTYYGADGIKTGFINASGHNLAASAVRGGKRLIAIVLGGDTQAWTREHATRLLDVSYAKIDPSLVMVATNASGVSPVAAAVVAASTSLGAASTPSARVSAAPIPNVSARTAVISAELPPPVHSGVPVATAPLPLPNATATLAAYAAETSGAAPAAKPAAKPARSPRAVAAVSTATAVSAVTADATVTAVGTAAQNNAKEVVVGIEPDRLSPDPVVPLAPDSGDIPIDLDAPVVRNVADPRSAPAPRADPAASRNAPQVNAGPEPAAEVASARPQQPEPTLDQGATSERFPEKASGDDWSVQIGMFKDASIARRRGEEARALMPLQLRAADLLIGRSQEGPGVISRIGHLSEQDARAGCAQLQRGRLPCVVVPPGRPLIVATTN